MKTKRRRKSTFFSINPLHLPRMVIRPFRNRVQNFLEALLLSGTLGRLGVAAFVIAVVSFLMGLLGYLAALGSEQAFSNPFEGVWWAFLRLSDPGYLGDDDGYLLRMVSTVVTVAGYVLFMGVLVAILTQGLNEKIRRLEMGLTPISANKHVILLGWNNRTPWMVGKFLISEGRVGRFLRRVGARRLKLVLLVEEVSPRHSLELKNFIGPDWKSNRVVLRSGTPLRLDHLMRVDYLRSSAILLPALDRSSEDAVSRSDDATVKAVLSIDHSLRLSEEKLPPPLLVAELYDARKITTVLQCYQGPIEVVASDEVISRMVAQMTRHPYISDIYRELLSMGAGNELYIRDVKPGQIGKSFWGFAQKAASALVIGVTRESERRITPLLNPPADYCFSREDKIVYIADHWGDLDTLNDAAIKPWPEPGESLEKLKRDDEKLLVLGWSRRMPDLLEEYESYLNQRFDITIASRMPVETRQQQIDAHGSTLQRTKVVHKLIDYTIPENLAALNPESFDTVVCLSSEGSSSDEDADARTLVAHTILQAQLAQSSRKPRVILELLDELNVGLISGSGCEYLLTPHVLGFMLVEVSLRRELNAVFQELFNSGDTEITFRDFERYGLAVGDSIAFHQVQRLSRDYNEIALGIFKTAKANQTTSGKHINPDRNKMWTLENNDKFIVLRR